VAEGPVCCAAGCLGPGVLGHAGGRTTPPSIHLYGSSNKDVELAHQSTATRLMAEAQTQVSEPVLGVLVAFLGSAQYRSRRTTDQGFTNPSILAAGAGSLHIFEAPATIPKVGGLIGSWPWDEITVSATARLMSSVLELQLKDGSTTKFKVRSEGMNRFQVSVIEEIIRRADPLWRHGAAD